MRKKCDGRERDVEDFQSDSGVGKFRNVSKGKTEIKGKDTGFVPKTNFPTFGRTI